MFLKASLRAAGAVALILSQCILPAWGHPVNTTDQFQIVSKRAGFLEIHCAGADARNVQFALQEARALVLEAQTSHKMVVAFLDKLDTFASSYKTDARTWSATQAFEALFGKSFYEVYSSENAAGKARAKYISDGLQNLANALAQPATMPFDIYCGDSWLGTEDLQGDTSQNPYEYWDSRPGSQTTQWLSFAPVQGRCRPTAEGFYAVVFGKPPLYDNPVMTICSGWLNHWGASISSGQTINNLYNSPISSPVHLDQFALFSMTAAILHELMHVQPVMFPSSPEGMTIIDQPCPIKAGSAYGYECITALAQKDPNLAVNNADTWAYYVIALALSNYNWATGLSMPSVAGPPGMT